VADGPIPPRRSPVAEALRALQRPPVLIATVTLVAVGAVAVVLALGQAAPARLSLSEMEGSLASGDVRQVTLDDRSRVATLELADGGAATVAYPEGYGEVLVQQALEHGVDVGVEQGPANPAGAVLLRLLPLLLIGGLVFLVVRQRVNVGPFGVSRAKPATIPATRFGDVAGADEAAAELAEVVSYLSDPDRFRHLGARAPKGVLLFGPPGTGKTLLARAVAGEAGVAFFALSGSDFVEKFVGVGASRVRSVFDKARKAGRAIVFIDELDAVGKSRGVSVNSNDEREQTLNQLLVEMDGFDASEIVVLAATNRPDTLDAALTRPGRFDRQITVGLPDRAGREAILRLHFAGRPLADVDVAALSRRTPGLTGADLANVVNQAALAAARAGADVIGQRHVDDAVATVTLGRERRSAEVLERDRLITAWHEAGHTVAALMQPEAADPAGVSIVPRGHAGGVTWMNGDDHQFLLAPQARAQLAVAMAGRAAEELIYGAAYSQGAAGDLRSATDLATRMAADYGMSPLVGPVHIPDDQRQVGETADLLNRAVKQLLVEALDAARAVVEAHRLLLDAIARDLLEHETLDADQLAAIRERVQTSQPAP
jgi:cell division protease FtsH